MTPIPPHIAAIERPVPALLKWYFFHALATTFAFPITMAVFYFRYHTMRYRFDEEGVHMRWGILMRREVMLNYARIQDIQLKANVIERWLGLARIEIQTASGSAASTMTLEGMADHEGMRDFLYTRMRGVRERKEGALALAGAGLAGGTEAGAGGDALAAALTEVAVELRAIRELLEKRGHA
jgi:uncharacterized protein